MYLTQRIKIATIGRGGYTLVETVVTGFASTFIATAILSMLSMQTHEINSSTGNAFLQSASQVVIEQIGHDIRKANRLLVPGETWSLSGIYSATTTQTLLIYSNTGSLLKGYRINSGAIEETANGAQWVRFLVGSIPVSADPGGYFVLYEDRKETVIDFHVQFVYKGQICVSNSDQELFRCRN